MKYKIIFLFDKTNIWIKKYINPSNFIFKNKFKVRTTSNVKDLKKYDIVIILGYTKIINPKILSTNKLNIIVHPSKLPDNKGFAPIAYQVLKNKKNIYFSIIKLEKKVDSGDIILQNKVSLNGTELSNELREIQAYQTIKILKNFLKNYPRMKLKKQKGKGNFNKRRTKKDSEININKSIKSQFNHLRICDNDKYPAFFKYKNNKYLLKIFKEIKN